EDGTPGAVDGIGADLALHLAAPDLGGHLARFAGALGQARAGRADHVRRTWGQRAVEGAPAREDAPGGRLGVRLDRRARRDGAAGSRRARTGRPGTRPSSSRGLSPSPPRSWAPGRRPPTSTPPKSRSRTRSRPG